MGRIHLREPGGEPNAIGDRVCAVGRKIHSLESAATAFRQADRLRCAGKLEVNLSKLFGMLSLSVGPSCALKNDALRRRRKRLGRGSFSGRVHAHHQRQQLDDEWQCLRDAGGGHQRGGSSTGFLLFHFPEYVA